MKIESIAQSRKGVKEQSQKLWRELKKLLVLGDANRRIIKAIAS